MSSVEFGNLNKPIVVFETLHDGDQEKFLAMAELEQRAYGGHVTLTADQFKEKVQKGAVIGAIYDGNRIVGNVVTLVDADPEGEEPILQRLPEESLYADGTCVDPTFRGGGLQKTLLDKRRDLARERGKETIIGSVRPENGASLRSITSTGGRILAYSPNYYGSQSAGGARLIWETDTTLQNEAEEIIEKKDALEPEAIMEALERVEQKIVLLVQSGEKPDVEAQKAIEKILSEDYIGTGLQTLQKDASGVLNGMIFRHLSSFPPEVAKRLRERREKIQEILELSLVLKS